jgi:hypothetical protein
MLRICYLHGEGSHEWTLCGQLAGLWVGEFRICWERTRATGPLRTVVNLSDVTFIDEKGERLLSDMHGAGVEFVAAGVATKHLLENLAAKGERPLRRVVGLVENQDKWRNE